MISTDKIIEGIRKELIALDKEYIRLTKERREIVRLWGISNKIKNDLISANK